MKFYFSIFSIYALFLISACGGTSVKSAVLNQNCDDYLNSNTDNDPISAFFTEEYSIYLKMNFLISKHPVLPTPDGKYMIFRGSNFSAYLNSKKNALEMHSKFGELTDTILLADLVRQSNHHLRKLNNVSFKNVDKSVAQNGLLTVRLSHENFLVHDQPSFTSSHQKTLVTIDIKDLDSDSKIFFPKNGFERWVVEPYTGHVFQIYFDKHLGKRFLESRQYGKIEITYPYWESDFKVFMRNGQIIIKNKGKHFIGIWTYPEGRESQMLDGRLLKEFDGTDVKTFDLFDRDIIAQTYGDPNFSIVASDGLVDKYKGSEDLLYRNSAILADGEKVLIFETLSGALIIHNNSRTFLNHSFLCRFNPKIAKKFNISANSQKINSVKLYSTLKTAENKNLLVFLHGGPWGHSSNEFHSIDKALELEFDVLHVNYPGSVGFGVDYTISSQLKDTKLIVSGIGDYIKRNFEPKYDHITIVGHSFGAFLAAQLTLNNVESNWHYYLISGAYNLQELLDRYRLFEDRTNSLAGHYIDEFVYDQTIDPNHLIDDVRMPNLKIFYSDNDRILKQEMNKTFYKKVSEKCSDCIVSNKLNSHTPLSHEYDFILETIANDTFP